MPDWGPGVLVKNQNCTPLEKSLGRTGENQRGAGLNICRTRKDLTATCRTRGKSRVKKWEDGARPDLIKGGTTW